MAEKSYYTNTRPEMMAFVPSDRVNILELGCGEGDFGAALQYRQKATVTGVELMPEAAEAARRKLHQVFTGKVEEVLPLLPHNTFDCVVCNDILEHLYDPYSLLKNLHPYLQPNAVIISSIPNIRYIPHLWRLIVHKEWKYEDYGILDRTHVRFFTGKSIAAMFEEAGFSIVRQVGINPMPLPKALPFILLSGGLLSDGRYLQFATIAQKTA